MIPAHYLSTMLNTRNTAQAKKQKHTLAGATLLIKRTNLRDIRPVYTVLTCAPYTIQPVWPKTAGLLSSITLEGTDMLSDAPNRLEGIHMLSDAPNRLPIAGPYCSSGCHVESPSDRQPWGGVHSG